MKLRDMGFFKNVGTESVLLCKKLADFNDLKTADIQDVSPWSWPIIYIMQNTGTCAVIRYLLDSKRINIDDLINYIQQSKSQQSKSQQSKSQYNSNREALKNTINYYTNNIAAKMYNLEVKTIYCYGGPNGGMADKHALSIFNSATELLKYLNIKYIKKGSSKQHNIRIVFK